MHTYERNGVQIEQCRQCRGIFLDRGELEQLIGAESAFLGRGHAVGDGDEQQRGRQRRGFFSGLFD
jgi:Zn-finger nucleic acid-binding protein